MSQFVRFSITSSSAPAPVASDKEKAHASPSAAGYVLVGLFTGAVLVLLLLALIWLGIVVKSIRDGDLLAAGEDNRTISEITGWSESRLRTRIRSLYERLGVTGRAEAVAAALRLHLID